ncbi:hypothetical protein OE88DRAFT_1729788 [Heliocybe sulcata]|uniref:Uncharacterized protein n=1 Tax=Heliocybe sulcata TaxID=5364 RepID=A0A5C3MMQ6_9AGAM|nr:hypothetical protein OE88DRAFT_1729788 [Heliocybe sulcata]
MTTSDNLSLLELCGFPTESLRPGTSIAIGDEEHEYYDSSDDGSVEDAPGPGRMLDKLVNHLSVSLENSLSRRAHSPLRTSSQNPGNLKLRGYATGGLSSGTTVTIGQDRYEYCSSSDDESLDDPPGAGQTLGKLVKRVSIPIEKFLSFCSDLSGHGPDAVFTRISDNSYLNLGKHSKRLDFWIKLHPEDAGLYHPSAADEKKVERLMHFVTDRRYNLSVRLTAAHYLVLLLSYTHHTDLSSLVSPISSVLLRICQEGTRRGCSPSILRPLGEVVVYKDYLPNITDCTSREISDAIVGPQNGHTSSLVLLHQLYTLWDLRGHRHKSDVEAVYRAMKALQPEMNQLPSLPPDASPLEFALRRAANIWYKRLVESIPGDRREVEMNKLIERMQYTIPCGRSYGSRYMAGSWLTAGYWIEKRLTDQI